MNKPLFWTGLTFQIIQLSILMIILLSSIDWSFLTNKFLVIGIFIVLNIISLMFMLVGALREDKK